MESELLRLLNETRGSLLEDAALFNTLQISKATAEEVTRSLETSEKTEVQIDAAREVFQSTFLNQTKLKTLVGLPTLCQKGRNPIFRIERHGKHRSNVSICLGRLHISVRQVDR